MAHVEIDAGICGFTTIVDAVMDGDECVLTIESPCTAIQEMGAELGRVDPFREILFRGKGPAILDASRRHCHHPACPVPAGVVKAVEVAAGLALPRDAVIRVSR